MTPISHILKSKFSLVRIVLVLLVSLAAGVGLVFLPEEALLLSLSVPLVLFALISNNLYALLLWACPLTSLFAQFQVSAIELMRWVSLLLLGVLSAYVVQKRKLARNPVALGLSLVALYSMVTSTLSYYPTVSLLKSISLLLLGAVLLFVPPAVRRLHRRVGAREYVLRMYLRFAIAVVVSNAVYYLIRPSSSYDFFSGSSLLAGRFRGWFINPNGIGAIYGIFFLPILGFAIGKHRMGLAKLGLLLTFLLATIQLLACQSRAGILAGTVSVFVLILGQKKWPSRIATVGMIGLILVATYLGNPQDNLIRRFVYRNEITFEGSGRFPVWVETWNRFLARPFFGSGLGVADTGSDAGGVALSTGGYTIEKGNSYLGALEELGMVGVAVLILALLAPLLRACWRGLDAANSSVDNSNLVLIAIVAAGLANALFEAWLLSVGSFLGFSFWVFASLLHREGDL